MKITINIVDTLFDSIPKGTVVANYVTEVGTVNFKMYSTVYSIDETNKAIITTKNVDANNLEAIHFDAINWVTTDKTTINNIYPKVVSKYLNKFKKEGVIYKITKDYDLNHCVLTIPDNCTLLFEGGSITNGTLSFEDDTKIKGHFIGNAIIEGNPYYIDYTPDEEDTTIVKDVIKFKDKDYDVSNFSGLGRVYLRKNIVNVEDPVTGNIVKMNYLTQSMISKEDTIYIVQYSYNLNKQTISIPEGSILVFEGGDINNGTINCNGTVIVGKFGGNATITGAYSFQDAQADEEDITQNQSSVLKFKDKEYDEANFSGLGRTYLRKNIVANRNILTQDMVNNSNTIYHIQYDYNLNGQTITIPEGCVLKFNGGSISNGTINGNNAIINNSSDFKIFNNCILNNFNIRIWNIKWFGAIQGEDISIILQQWYDNCYLNHIYSKLKINGYYKIENTVNFKYGINIFSDGDSSSHANEDGIFSSIDNSKLNIGAVLTIAENIIAFEIGDYPTSDPTYSRIGQIQLNNIRFISNNHNSTLFSYKGGGAPDRKFIAIDCEFKGFDICFNFKGATRPAGSIASGFRIEHCKFTSCNYSIYSKMENSVINGQVITPITLNFMYISRSSFLGENGSTFTYFPKLYLSGLYGASRIEYSAFECAQEEAPIYCGLYWGNIVFEGNYIENYRGKIHFKNEATLKIDSISLPDTGNAIAEIHSNYGVWTGRNSFVFDGVVAILEPMSLRYYNVYLNDSIIKEGDLFNTFGGIYLNTIAYSDYDNTAKVCSLGSPNCLSIGDAQGGSHFIGMFKSNNEILIDPNTNLKGCSININNSVELNYNLISDNLSAVSVVFSLFKTAGTLKLELINNNVTAKTIYIGNSSGTYLIRFNNTVTGGDAVLKIINTSGNVVQISRIGVRNYDNSLTRPYISAYLNIPVDELFRGYNSQLPVLSIENKGYQYYNNDYGIYTVYNGTEWTNIDGTFPSKVINAYNKIVIYIPNVIYRIVSDIDLQGQTLTLPANCTLDFQGGSFTNGTIILNNTKVLPLGCNIEDYVTATIDGSYKEGQILYDSVLKKMKLWNGTDWVNIDGTSLT